ncbi:copper resistance CopC family protein [Nocardioides sp.]|jgi:hypothetical protein|uniref:Unannotated protein n=1 Tax=freshwater metagenome TaxID=449393 RepID=A0A6J6V7Q1_9ZZZZ|nr:copper resistance CopC family protein [uncultured Nocardioides sp.]MCK5927163.1 copper resistance protein CopC [Nocardioides sp.]MSY86174.1 hypothetical protein [Actinomycetota bacterium]
MTRRLLLIATLILLSWPTPPASAHTDLVSITPAEGSRVVGGWPPEVVLAFTEAIDPTLSAVSVSVDGQDGTRVPLGLGLRSTEVVGDLRALKSVDPTTDHRVRISYRVTSADGHPVAGTSTFTIAPDAGSPPTPGAAETTTPEAAPVTPTPPSRTAPASDGASATGLATGAWVAAGLVALVLLSAVVSSRTGRSESRATDGKAEQ